MATIFTVEAYSDTANSDVLDGETPKASLNLVPSYKMSVASEEFSRMYYHAFKDGLETLTYAITSSNITISSLVGFVKDEGLQTNHFIKNKNDFVLDIDAMADDTYALTLAVNYESETPTEFIFTIFSSSETESGLKLFNFTKSGMDTPTITNEVSVSNLSIDVSDVQSLINDESNTRTDFTLSNQDWLKYIDTDDIDGFVYVNNNAESNFGVSITGPKTFYIDKFVPIDPEATYRISIRVKAITASTNARFYCGVDSLDNNGTRITTDMASTFNYGVANEETLVAGTTHEFTGVFSGYNLDTESDNNKFDPHANYFRIAINASLNGEGTDEVLIEVISVEKISETTKHITSTDTGTQFDNKLIENVSGINFGGDTLEDYEEGTWSPAFEADGSTYSTAVNRGTYIRLGNIVHIEARILHSHYSASLSNSEVRITNLPFSVNSDNANVVTYTQNSQIRKVLTLDHSDYLRFDKSLANPRAFLKASELVNADIYFSFTYKTN